MTDVGRLADLLDRAAATMVHVTADRVTPLAVPVLTLIGRERVATGLADDALLAEAETLAAEAIRRGCMPPAAVPARDILCDMAETGVGRDGETRWRKREC